ncbi:MAG: glycoside hydrolase family 25 protein [Bdellovibrionales bacterium]
MNLLWVVLILGLSACAPYKKSAYDGESGSPGLSDIDPGQGPAGETPPLPTPGRIPAPSPGPDVRLPSSADPFDQPWKVKETAIVIDAYQGNSIDWDKMATDKRVAGVLHRSSIGLQEDTQYKARTAIAKSRGYLWGAYHLGRSGDPIAQADFFLNVVGSDPETLWVLDLEDFSNPSMMSASDAVKFMNYLFNKTGRIPVIYANHSVTQALNQAVGNEPVFKKSKLWYARFRSNIPDFPSGIWSSYFLWQFSSEINCTTTGQCLYNVPGTKFDMDVNVFFGTKGELSAAWKN